MKKVKDDIIAMLSTAIVNGFGDAALLFCTKLLAYTTVVVEELPEDSKAHIERKVRTCIDEVLAEQKERRLSEP